MQGVHTDPPPDGILGGVRPWHLILIGFGLSLVGVALPFLMVIQVVESTFFLNFVAFAASLIGLLLGIIGAVQYVRRRSK